MLIPFPQSLSIGTDIVYLPRLGKSQAHFKKLASKILQPQEQKHLDYRFPGWAGQVPNNERQMNRVREWLGGRFAAKEAAKKAWGASLIGFQDLRISGERGEPLSIICTPFVDEVTPRGKFEQAAKLTIAHDGEYATATVLASPLHNTILAELGRRKAEAEKKVTNLGIDKTKRSLEEPEHSEINKANELDTSTFTIKRTISDRTIFKSVEDR